VFLCLKRKGELEDERGELNYDKFSSPLSDSIKKKSSRMNGCFIANGIKFEKL